MPRPRERVCWLDGLKLDLNRLARQGFVRRGANIGLRGIRWTHSYWGEIASGTISADMSGPHEGWFRIQGPAVVLYVPRHESSRVRSLEAERRDAILQSADLGSAAYQSQFNDVTNRAHAGQQE